MSIRRTAVAVGLVLMAAQGAIGAMRPAISELSPNRGSTGGGTVVTILGTGFTGATSVTFDGVAGTGLVVVNDSELRITTPPHSAGVFDVVVNGVGGADTLPAGFSFGNVPSSFEDTYTVQFNTPLQVGPPGVLENDASNGGGAMVVELVTDVTSGSLILEGNGGFNYTPSPGFTGRLYFFYRASNNDGIGNVARVVINVAESQGPQAPTGLRASLISGNNVTLRFTPSPFGVPADGFEVEAGFSPGATAGTLLTGSTHPIFTFTAPNGPLYIRVRSLASGLRSAPSNEIVVYVNVPLTPSPPDNLLGLVNGDTLALGWRNSYAAGLPSSLVLDVSGSLSTSLPLGLTESFSFSGVPAGTYTFTLRALNALGSSAASAPVTLSFPGPCTGPPQTPAGFVAYASGNTIVILWDLPPAGPAPTGYVLNVGGPVTGQFPTAGKQMSGTVGPGTYTFNVVAVNACGASVATATVTITVP